jgi:hypothetical protein
MCKALLLQNIGVFSVFHIEKPAALFSFWKVKEQRKKRKIIQTMKTKKELQSRYRHGVKKKKEERMG